MSRKTARRSRSDGHPQGKQLLHSSCRPQLELQLLDDPKEIERIRQDKLIKELQALELSCDLEGEDRPTNSSNDDNSAPYDGRNGLLQQRDGDNDEVLFSNEFQSQSNNHQENNHVPAQFNRPVSYGYSIQQKQHGLPSYNPASHQKDFNLQRSSQPQKLLPDPPPTLHQQPAALVPAMPNDLEERQLLDALKRSHTLKSDMRGALAGLVSALDSSLEIDAAGVVSHQLERCRQLQHNLNQAQNLAQVNAQKLQALEASSEREIEVMDGRIKRLEAALSQANSATQQANASAMAAVQQASDESKRLQDRYMTVTKEVSDWKEKSEESEAKAEARAAEVSELHRAMAGLHAELSVVSKELEASSEAKDKLARDLLKAEIRADKGEKEAESAETRARDLERQLRGMNDTYADALAQSEDSGKKALAEVSAARASLAEKNEELDRLRTELTTFKITNSELNDLSQKLASEVEAEARERKLRSGKEAEVDRTISQLHDELRHSRSEIESLVSKLRELETAKDRASAAQVEAEVRCDGLALELERTRQMANRLEREKQDMIIESENMKSAANGAILLAKEHEMKRSDAESFVRSAEEEIQRHKNNHNNALAELEESRAGLAAANAKVDVVMKEAQELKAALEQGNQSAKNRDKETAQRMVEISQMNAKQATEISSMRQRLSMLEEERINHTQSLEDANERCQQAKSEHRRAAARVQSLEEDIEVMQARSQALTGQLDAYKAREAQLKEDYEDKLKVSSIAATTAIAQAENGKMELQRKLNDMENQRVIAARKFENSIAELKTEVEKLERNNKAEAERRHREVSEAHNRTAAVTSALEVLQLQLAEQEQKNKTLRAQRGSLTSGEDSVPPSARPTPDRATEAELTSLRRLIETAETSREAALVKAKEAEARASSLGTVLERTEKNLSEKETELANALRGIDVVEAELHTAQRQLSERDTSSTYALAEKEDELNRLRRRNEVLMQAITRLTAANTTSNNTINNGVGGGRSAPASPSRGNRAAFRENFSPQKSPGGGRSKHVSSGGDMNVWQLDDNSSQGSTHAHTSIIHDAWNAMAQEHDTNHQPYTSLPSHIHTQQTSSSIDNLHSMPGVRSEVEVGGTHTTYGNSGRTEGTRQSDVARQVDEALKARANKKRREHVHSGNIGPGIDIDGGALPATPRQPVGMDAKAGSIERDLGYYASQLELYGRNMDFSAEKIEPGGSYNFADDFDNLHETLHDNLHGSEYDGTDENAVNNSGVYPLKLRSEVDQLKARELSHSPPPASRPARSADSVNSKSTTSSSIKRSTSARKT